jgi:hypothetical protein
MLISGVWHLCDDGCTRPVFRGEILAGDGTWVQARFLVDIGADRTVFSADILEALHPPPLVSPDRLAGVGGVSPSVGVQTQIVFFVRTAAESPFEVNLRRSPKSSPST